MNYGLIYKKICDRGKYRRKKSGIFLEKHHIIPLFFFKKSKRKHRHSDGIYDGDGEHIGNITYLTPREHFIAHLLLCKIWKKTKWEYRCFTSVNMFLIGGVSNNNRNVFSYSSKVMEKYRKNVNFQLSKGKTGTMPAKVLETGERLGIVDINHPNVLSGKWVHITKGIKKNDQQKKHNSNISTGLLNGNSKYSDKELLNSYKKCCYYYKKLVNNNFWVLFCIHHNLPYLKHWKMFRFNNMGFLGMQTELLKLAKKEKIEIEIISNYKSHDWRQFVLKEKENGYKNRKNIL